MTTDEYDNLSDERKDRYRRFADCVYDKDAMLEALINADPTGKLDDNFQEFRDA